MAAVTTATPTKEEEKEAALTLTEEFLSGNTGLKVCDIAFIKIELLDANINYRTIYFMIK